MFSRVANIALLLTLSACGGRTDLGSISDADAGADPDARVRDTGSFETGPLDSGSLDATEEVACPSCEHLSDACHEGVCVAGACEPRVLRDGTACSDDDPCTSEDSCQQGRCVGTPLTCPSDGFCPPGICDPRTGECAETHDGLIECPHPDPCTQVGICELGSCVPWSTKDCSFLDDSCSRGICDATLGCISEPVPDGSPCDDGLVCVTGEGCFGGQCVGFPLACSQPNDPCSQSSCRESSGGCVTEATNEGASCDDTDPCTVADSCRSGVCQGSAVTQCISGDGCCPTTCGPSVDSDCGCCGEKINPFTPSTNCGQGATWLAWEYLPNCSYELTRIELHTSKGRVALLDDRGNMPGSTLFEGTLEGLGSDGFSGANLSPPVQLVAGQRYWIAEAVSVCSIAVTGEQQPYYGGSSLGGPWRGPYASHHFTARLHGQCP